MLLAKKHQLFLYNNATTTTAMRYFSSQLMKDLKKKITIETYELDQLLTRDPQSFAVLNATVPRRDYVPREDHIKERISHSIFLDFKGFCDQNTKLSYMMPDEAHFTKMMRGINVRRGDNVVIYDKYRNISAPRTYFMMKLFGL